MKKALKRQFETIEGDLFFKCCCFTVPGLSKFFSGNFKLTLASFKG